MCYCKQLKEMDQKLDKIITILSNHEEGFKDIITFLTNNPQIIHTTESKKECDCCDSCTEDKYLRNCVERAIAKPWREHIENTKQQPLTETTPIIKLGKSGRPIGSVNGHYICLYCATIYTSPKNPTCRACDKKYAIRSRKLHKIPNIHILHYFDSKEGIDLLYQYTQQYPSHFEDVQQYLLAATMRKTVKKYNRDPIVREFLRKIGFQE